MYRLKAPLRHCRRSPRPLHPSHHKPSNILAGRAALSQGTRPAQLATQGASLPQHNPIAVTFPSKHPKHIFVVVGHSIGAYLAVYALADVPTFPAVAMFQAAPTLFGLGAQAGVKRLVCSPYVSPWLGLAFGAIGWTPAFVRRCLILNPKPRILRPCSFSSPFLHSRVQGHTATSRAAGPLHQQCYQPPCSNFSHQPSDFGVNLFRSSLLRNVASMANDEFVQLSELQPVASIMCRLQIPIKLLCAAEDEWVPPDYIQQYKSQCETASCSVVVSPHLSHRSTY